MPPLDYPIETTILPNGLRVVVSEDHSVPSISMNLWVDVGSRHEEAGRTGLAHLFEHLMFQGSELVGEGEHMSLLMAHGGRCNATTSFDRTTYVATIPTGALELLLWLEADRHGHLLPALTEANLDNQRDVVVEEKRQRYDTVPYGQAMAHICEQLFPEGHPYRHLTIGSMEDLQAADLADVHSFYTDHYGPGTSVLTFVGDVEPQTAFDLAHEYLGHLEDHTLDRPEPGPVLGPLPSALRLDLVEDVPSSRLYLAFRLPPSTDPEFLACAIALDALGSLTLARLQQRLVRTEEIASGCWASAVGLVDGASLGVLVLDVTQGVDPEHVEAAITEELNEFAQTGPTESELESSRSDTERAWLEALASHEERAELLSRATAILRDPHHINTYLDRVVGIDAEHVRAAAARWLNPAHALTLRYLQPEHSIGDHPSPGVPQGTPRGATDSHDERDIPAAAVAVWDSAEAETPAGKVQR